MSNISISEYFALLALDGLSSTSFTKEKQVVLRGIVVANDLDCILENNNEPSEDLILSTINKAVNKVKHLRRSMKKTIEKNIVSVLQEKKLLGDVPDLLGCDLNYQTAEITMKVYKSDAKTYLLLREELRAEILEEGAISLRCKLLLWLLRECGCMSELFSVKEQEEVQSRILELCKEDTLIYQLWQKEFHNFNDDLINRFLQRKKELFKNPYLEGVNLVFPFLNRRSAIFIDCLVLGTKVKDRREQVKEYLMSLSHDIEEVHMGSETLLKIDNAAYYRIFPTIKKVSNIPIQGVSLVPVYW